MEKLPEGQVFTTHQVASIFGVNPGTVVRWIKEGHLKAHRTPGGHNRIHRNDLVRFLAKCGRITLASSDKTLKILVIDDDSTVFDLVLMDMQRNFRDAIAVDWARDGFEGGRKVAEFKPDIVFLDLMMPGLDGFQVCREIKSVPASSDVEVVALTGYYSEENERKIMEAGASLCLSKPIDLELIRGLVDRRLAGGAAIQPMA